MPPLSEKDIRGSFVNCSKGEAQRMNVPRDLAGLDWETRDFLGLVGQYLCTDLACSLYARGLRAPAAGADLDESLSADEKVTRMLANLGTFLDQVTR